MTSSDLKLLDCTLRDGGYINDWNWGFHKAKAIISFLTKAKIDFIEVGFLRNVEYRNVNITVSDKIEDLNKLLPTKSENTIYSAMAMCSNYDINNLSPYCGSGIEMIRITAHDYDMQDGLDFAYEVKNRGYKISINPINIMGYADEKILQIIKGVNKIQPYQFSIVDTFGSMKRRDLDRIASLVDNNLDRNIRVALHLHENMSLSCSLAQNFIDKHLNRPISIDGSLMGMGRTPGNLPIELIADYCNDYSYKGYDIDYLMDAIQEYIAPLKGKTEWGYEPAYFLSARFNLHRNYAEYFLKKGDLTNRDINHILAGFDKLKTTVFDAQYADEKYKEYKNNIIDDKKDFTELKSLLSDKEILIIAPGGSIVKCQEEVLQFIKKNCPIVIAINFIPEDYSIDYAFFSNARRFMQADVDKCKLIITSNIETDRNAFKLNYNSLSSSFEQGYNSYVMLCKLLTNLGINHIYAAGTDGYTDEGRNYYKSSLKSTTNCDKNYNSEIKQAIQRIGLNVDYITDSAYK